MRVINVRNAHEALHQGLALLCKEGFERESRNGSVLMFDGPVTTVYEKPLERVVFWPERDCNPFFHFAESLWMLAGRNDVAFLTQYVPRMADFSDDGESFHGAYGHRWRKWFGFDQLREIIKHLHDDSNDRRQVLAMWDARGDLSIQKGRRDLPCNTQAIFSINRRGEVDMTVTNRSNDMILGAYGANAVHFSYLQEFVARALKLPVGRYWQVSNNLHAYKNNDLLKVLPLLNQPLVQPYEETFEGAPLRSSMYSLMSNDHEDWTQELQVFLSKGAQPGMDPFFRRVAQPIFQSHAMYQQKKDPNRFIKAMDALDHCVDGPWSLACKEWISRRLTKAIEKQKAADDGVRYE